MDGDQDQPVVTTAVQPQAAPPPAPRPEPSQQGLNDQDQTPIEPSGGQNDEPGVQEARIKPSRWEQLGAVLKQTSDASLVGLPGLPDSPGSMIRAYTEHSIAQDDQKNGVAKLQPDVANKMFPGMPVPFNEPIDPNVAATQYGDFQRRQKLQAWKDRGDPIPWIEEKAVGLAGGLTDPSNLLLMATTGPVLKVAGLAAEAATVAGKVAANFMENLGINTITGVPNYLQQKAEHQKVNAWDSIVEGVESSAMMTGFHFAVVQPIMNALKSGAANVKATPTDITAKNLQTALVQHESGAKIDTTLGDQEASARARGMIEGQDGQYIHKPADLATPFYGAKDANGDHVQFQELGPGISTIDDGAAANHHVSNPDGEQPGKVGQYKIPEGSKLLDIEQSAASPEMEPFVAKLESSEEIPRKLPDGVTFTHDPKENYIQAMKDGKEIGSLLYKEQEDGSFRSESTDVRPGHQRQGIATEMYKMAMEATNGRLKPSFKLSPDAQAFWKARYPEQYSERVNNIASEWLREQKVWDGMKGEPQNNDPLNEPYLKSLENVHDVAEAVRKIRSGDAEGYVAPKRGATTLDIHPDESLKDVLLRLSPEDKARAQEIAKGEGYEGYQGLLDVKDGDPKNLVHLFDDTQEPVQPYRANPDITPTSSQEQIEALNQSMGARENQAGYTPELEQRVHDLKHGESPGMKPSVGEDPSVKQINDYSMERLKELAENDPELKEEMEKILDRDAATDAQEKGVFKQFVGCIVGSMT